MSKKNESIHEIKENRRKAKKKNPDKVLGAAVEIDSDISERKKAKEKLHENEERMRAIIEGTPHLFFYTQDAEANTTYVSPAIEHITGYKTDVWLKRGDWFITDATMNQVAKERTHANLQGEFTEEPILLEIRHASGHPIQLEVYEYPITKNGRVVGLQGVAHDITQRKLVESQREVALKMLQESEERYRQLVELSPDAISVHSEGKIVFVNPETVKLLGAQCAEELLGKPALEMVHPNFRSIAAERIHQSIKQGGLTLPHPEKFIRVDGAAVDVEVSAIPIVYKGKQAMQVIARDITERKRAEEEIKMLATALKKINECVSITDVENTILFVNEAFLKTYGYSEQELIGQNIKIVRPPNSPQEVFEEVLPGTLSGGWTGELVNRRKDGSEFPIFLSTTIIEKKDGKPNCLIGIAIDITERKRTELQIKEALETIRRSEENFRSSLADSPLGVRVVTAKGETIYANKVLLDIYGYANVEELNKIPLKERYTPQSYAEFHIRKKARERGDLGPSEYDINIVRKNGEIRYLQVLRKEALWNGAKQFQVIYQDITERKQAESEKEDILAALRESEEKFRKIFEDHSAVKLLIEPESGAIIDANKAAVKYYGWTRAELKHMHIQQINILPAEQVKLELKKAQQRKCVHFEFRHRRADGSIRDVEVFSSGIEMAGKDILHFIIQDITERKRSEEALEKRLVALTRPLDESASIEFEDLFNLNDIQRLQDEFAKATGVASIITHPDGTPITEPSNFCRLCKDIIRKTDKGRANCYKSDSVLGHFSAQGPSIQPCMSGGLWDAGAGISIGGHHIANWLIGQVRDETQSEDKMRKYAREIGADESDLIEAFHEVTAMPQEQFQRIAQALFTLANQLSAISYQNIQQARFITEHKRVENIAKARLRLLEFANSHSMDELLTATLDEIEALTGSTIGFYHFVESDQKTLSLQNWSTNTLKNMCTATGKGSHYDVAQAGVWADCVHQRRPVIHNDYISLTHRKGTPEGHASVVREVVIPIFRGNLIKAIIGVGNKSTDYNEDDIEVVSQVGDLSWDITERKQAEEKIRNSLAEKEVLLKEVHHRVKNNLMIIIGLIKMQEAKADNKMFSTLLVEIEGRVRAMAQVHEGFYKSADLAHVDLQNYIETMGAQISAQFGADRNIRFLVQAIGVEVGLDVAVPCGLILNEMITNAYKHAFPGDKPRAGEDNCVIKVIVEQEGGVLTLTVTNNGVGLPADLDLEKSETLGLRLIKMLSQQINGSIELDRSTGTTFRLRFAHSSGGK